MQVNSRRWINSSIGVCILNCISVDLQVLSVYVADATTNFTHIKQDKWWFLEYCKISGLIVGKLMGFADTDA